MNFKKIKKSLVSIVLGSSFFVNGGVICQQPKALFPEGFLKTAKKIYENDHNMTLIINFLELFSDKCSELSDTESMTLLTEIFLTSAENSRDYRDYIEKAQQKDLYIITTPITQLYTSLARLTLTGEKHPLSTAPAEYFRKMQSCLTAMYGEKSVAAGQTISELLIKILDSTLATLKSHDEKDQPYAEKCLQLVDDVKRILKCQITLLKIKNVTTIAKIDVD